MRILSAVLTLAALAAAVSCSGNSGATTPGACAGLRRPGIPLAFAPAASPTRAQARCLAVQYAAVIGRQSWGRLPRVMRAAGSSLAVWQSRSLLYACNGCGLAGFGLAWVQAHHSDWILHSPLGTEVHPNEHPNWVLLDFANPRYQYAWAVHVRHSLAAGGWTGVEVIDAGNDPDWSDVPLDPTTDKPMTEVHRRRYLARALTLVRAALKIQGYSLLADNGPASTVNFDQINSTDAVSAGRGFAGLSGDDWDTEFHYYQHVGSWEVGAYVPDPPPVRKNRRLFGLASYLLVAIPRQSAYIAPMGPQAPLYSIHPGAPPDTPAMAVGSAWVRTYPNAVVAVNPSQIAAVVELGSAGRVNLPPRSAAIATDGHLLTSG